MSLVSQEILDLSSGSFFQFTDPGQPITQNVQIFNGTRGNMVSLGNILNPGPQTRLLNLPFSAKIIYAPLDSSYNSIYNIDSSKNAVILKVLDLSGVMFTNLTNPIPMEIYMDQNNGNSLLLNVGNNSAGVLTYQNQVGNKFRYFGSLTRGDGLLEITYSMTYPTKTTISSPKLIYNYGENITINIQVDASGNLPINGTARIAKSSTVFDVVQIVNGQASYTISNWDVNNFWITVKFDSELGKYFSSFSNRLSMRIIPKDLSANVIVSDKIYDGETQAVIQSITLDGVINNDDVSMVADSTNFLQPDVGENKSLSLTGFRLIGSKASNYRLVYIAPTSAKILPKPIQGIFTVSDKVYDNLNSATVLTRGLTGIVNSDVSDVIHFGGTGYFTSNDVGNITVDLIGSGITGSRSFNYTLSSVIPAYANITTREIQGIFTSQTKPYDGNNIGTLLSKSLFNLISGDDVVLNITSILFDNSDVGTNKTVNATGYISGAKSNNYNLTSIQPYLNGIITNVLNITNVDTSLNVFRTNSFQLQLNAFSGTGVTWSIASGSLPPGLSLNGSTGLISGIPTVVGNYSFTIHALNISMSQNKSFQINVLELIQITNGLLNPIQFLNLPSGSEFDFKDIQVPGLIQKCKIFQGVTGQALVLSDLSGFEFVLENPIPNYKYIFGKVDHPENFTPGIDYMFIFKVIDSNGNLVVDFTENPMDVKISLTENEHNKFIFFVFSETLNYAGQGKYDQKINNKYLYSCKITKGNGSVIMFPSNFSRQQLDKRIQMNFERLLSVNSMAFMDFLLSDPNSFSELENLKQNIKQFIQNKFTTRNDNPKIIQM